MIKNKIKCFLCLVITFCGITLMHWTKYITMIDLKLVRLHCVRGTLKCCPHNLHDLPTYIWFIQLVRAALIPVFIISESLSLHILCNIKCHLKCDTEARLREV